MTLEHIKTSLETLSYYEDCQIIQTLSKNQNKVASVSYIKERACFEITYLKTSNIETYTDIESAALAIEKVLNG
ncbi:hypothetical protein [Bacillus thermotolerans]|uniref:hypothetical protein n=1 Tax=Bacillus thermotolerans TaxID=1221996 RepID=UPI00057E3CC5|nr:hypothetical protein [Bacillus thermotolerans]KKB34409.1 hypothetical protein QY97_02482 [Bacillus thermotolerans]